MCILILLLTAVALAAPGSRNSTHHLSIKRTTVELDWRWLGTKSFPKYPLARHASQHSLLQGLPTRKYSARKRSNIISRILSKIPLSSEDDIYFWTVYTAWISLGTPPLHLEAIVDTSWSPFFVPSVNCTYDAHEKHNCMIHPLYNSSLSTTYRADLSPCKMVYWGLEGIQTSGKVSSDSLRISNLKIDNQVFEEATKWRPGDLTSDNLFDTVLGLALHPTYDEWGNFSAPGPFQNLVKQRLLRYNIFSLTMPRTDNEYGEIVFGGLPKNVTRDNLIEVPLNNTRRGKNDALWEFYTSNGWQILVGNISMLPVSSKRFLPVLKEQHIAVVSSSYPYIGLPKEAAKKANQHIGLTNGGTWVDCNTRSNLPDLVIAFSEEKEIRLQPRDYLLEVYDNIYRKLKCVSPFVSLESSGDDGMIILGSPILSGLHSVFDADRKSISFGNRQL